MDLGDFSLKNLGKDLLENKTFNNFVSNFIEELSEHLQNNKKTGNNDNKIDKFSNEMQHYCNERERIRTTTPLEENKTYVISGIYDNRLQVVDIDNGKELYPDFQIGDIVQRNDRIYNKVD